MGQGASADEQIEGWIREDVRFLAQYHQALLDAGFSREEAMQLLVAFGQVAVEELKQRRFNPPDYIPPPVPLTPHPSHHMVSVPDRISDSCERCGKSQFDITITKPCPTPPEPILEAP